MLVKNCDPERQKSQFFELPFGMLMKWGGEAQMWNKKFSLCQFQVLAWQLLAAASYGNIAGFSYNHGFYQNYGFHQCRPFSDQYIQLSGVRNAFQLCIRDEKILKVKSFKTKINFRKKWSIIFNFTIKRWPTDIVFVVIDWTRRLNKLTAFIHF